MALDPQSLSPKQQLKRRQIIDAALEILLREGPSGCGTRDIEAESGLNRGLIYYYFSTLEEIIDAAIGALFADLTQGIRKARQGHELAEERFWAVIESYLNVFDERPGVAMLWFEYVLSMLRAGERERVDRLQDGVVKLLTELLAEAGVVNAVIRARIVLAYVLGVVFRRLIHPVDFDELRPEIAALAGVSQLHEGPIPAAPEDFAERAVATRPPTRS